MADRINEQVEEEKSASDIFQSMELAGGSAQDLYMPNLELGKRKLNDPSDFSSTGGKDRPRGSPRNPNGLTPRATP
jgi:hypothetical protein